MNWKLVISFFIFIIFSFYSQNVFAYGVDTHAALTQEIFHFYNQHFPQNKISDSLKDYLIDGSRREDNTPRFFNHFYDPVYDRGLNDPIWGSGYASKVWAQDANKQNQITYKVANTIASILSAFQQKKLSLVSTESDFTWQRAIEHYVNGEPEKAMFVLGHVLHLIEDASVPAHTRNDGHPAVFGDEDSYEIWAYRFNQNNISQSLAKYLKDRKPIIFDSLNAYFNSMANYSNNNFYSNDTIGIQSGYDRPQINAEDLSFDESDYFGFATDEEGKRYRLVSYLVTPGNYSYIKTFKQNVTIKNDKVLQDYWSRLATKAVQHGAGVINLFFQEVEKAKGNFQTVQKPKSFLGQLIDSTDNLINKILNTGNKPDTVIPISERRSDDFESQLLKETEVSTKKSALKQCSFTNNQSPSRRDIIINEVAWMGSKENVNAEWIELKNISTKLLDVSEYQIIDAGEQILVSLPKGTIISPGGFYLLERGNDDAVPTVKANLIYQGALSNTNEGLRLFNGDCVLLDEVFANPNWPAGDNSTKQTMERSANLSWHTSINSGGTPKEENSNPQKQKEEQKQEIKKQELKTTTSIITSQPQNQTQKQNQQPQTNNCLYETSKKPSYQKLIINEVAWMGTPSDFNDEWIELKNISNSPLDISAYWLLDKGRQIKIKFESVVIPVGGFYLLEKTNDDTVPDIKADKIYSGALSNANEGLRLFDSQCNLLDEVIADPDWPAGDNVTKQTMERKTDLSWQTSAVVGGTPKTANSSGVIYSSGGGGGSGVTLVNNPQSPAKILISEVQITGGAGKTENDFIELYNPNNFQVNLKGYRLVKRTKTGTSDISIKSWTSDAYISANGYYLWANNNYLDIPASPDTTTASTISNDNGIAIRFGLADTGTIIDSVAWGEAQNIFIETTVFPTNPGANQSIQRKLNFESVEWFVDNNNNASDFEIQSCPSPKAQSRNCSTTNQAPSAFFVYTPQNPNVGDLIFFNAASSIDSDGQIVSYQWNFGDNSISTVSVATTTHTYSQAGDYQVSLIVFDNQNVSSTATSTIISVGFSSPSNVNHIVISEILTGTVASSSDEFIELYNPTNSPISLDGWYLKRKATPTSAEQNLVSKTSGAFNGKTIAARGFLLIASNQYLKDKTPDVRYSQNSVFLSDNGDIILLYNNSDTIVDEVSYGEIERGKSWERKAFSGGVCLSSQNDGEFLGNGCDTDSSNDWEQRVVPNPQNTQSLPEPRAVPSVVTNFILDYHFSPPTLTMNWDSSIDAIGSINAISYQIEEINSSSSKPIIFITTSTQNEQRIYEIGRPYEISIKAIDADGLASSAVFSKVNVPSFVNSVYFYRDPNPVSNLYLVDLYYDRYPFIPSLSTSNSNPPYKLIVFYLDEHFVVDSIFYNEYSDYQITNRNLPGAAVMRYTPCNNSDPRARFEDRTPVVVLPDSSCFPWGQSNRYLNPSQLEDSTHLQLALASSTADFVFSPSSDYLIVAFYDLNRWGLGTQFFDLVAVDKKRYYFRNEAPTSSPPFAPTGIATSYDFDTSELTISWLPSKDLDTLDFLLKYYLSVNNGDWQDVSSFCGPSFLNCYTKIMALPDTVYNLELKVSDYFGNSSSTLFATTTPPVPRPEYLVDNSKAVYTESKVIRSPYHRAGQLIKIPVTSKIRSIKFYFNLEEGGSALVKIFPKDTANGFATSTPLAVSSAQILTNGWVEFIFPSEPELTAGSDYWFIIYSDQYNWIGLNGYIYLDGFYLNYRTDFGDDPPVQARNALHCSGGQDWCDLMFILYDKR